MLLLACQLLTCTLTQTHTSPATDEGFDAALALDEEFGSSRDQGRGEDGRATELTRLNPSPPSHLSPPDAELEIRGLGSDKLGGAQVQIPEEQERLKGWEQRDIGGNESHSSQRQPQMHQEVQGEQQAVIAGAVEGRGGAARTLPGGAFRVVARSVPSSGGSPPSMSASSSRTELSKRDS